MSPFEKVTDAIACRQSPKPLPVSVSTVPPVMGPAGGWTSSRTGKTTWLLDWKTYEKVAAVSTRFPPIVATETTPDVAGAGPATQLAFVRE